METRLVAGCMTGTSLDGLDAALVAVTGRGLAMTATVQRLVSRPLGVLAGPLRRLADQQPLTAGEIARLGRDFALFHLEVLRELRGTERLDLVVVHGQTVFHAPPASWQMFAATPLALGLGVPVIYDLRAADLATGGQGAPITPLADYVFFRDAGETRGVLNLGGFCNYTWLPAAGSGDAAAAVEQIRGGDICVCNQLLDTLARTLFDLPYDEQGRLTSAGRVQPVPRDALLGALRAQAAAGRSLGTGDELRGWLERYRSGYLPEDLARSACVALAAAAVVAIGPVARLIVAGGGVKNRALWGALVEQARVPVVLTDELGVPSAGREAAEMAVLGALCQDGVPITLPQITGCRRPAPRAGTWVYP